MKNKIKTTYKVNTLIEMYNLNAKVGETCEICRECYKFNGKDWIPYKQGK